MKEQPDSANEEAPRGRAARGTPPTELARLARQESSHPAARPLRIQAMIWLLRASNAAINRQTEGLRPLDLSPSAFNVLQSLSNTPGRELEPWQIASRLVVSRPSVTGLLDTLEAKGMVRRRGHPADRRRVIVALTDEGRSTLESYHDEHYRRHEELFGALSDDELESLVILLRKVRGAVPPDLRDELPDAEPLEGDPPEGGAGEHDRAG